ncbi:hypothetical protein INR49_000525 [Caranx melampygus]|nr:hypothetical protein INR49_000525 [Caranx melampygus]
MTTSVCTFNQANTQTMDLLGRLEIYIPAEAEVKNVPLRSLPYSVLRRMGLPLSDSKGPMKLTGSPEVVWICPVTLRRKGQKAVENMSSVLGSEFQAAPGPLRMSFVSSNHAAYKMLKEMPGNKVSAQRSPSSSLHQGFAPQKHQDAVVIYHGNIYLSIKKPSGSQRKKQTPKPQPSTLSSKSQQRELLNDNRPKTEHATYEVTAHSAPHSTGSVHKVDSHCHKDAGGQQVAEELTTLEPDMDNNMQNDNGEGNQSNTSSEPLGAACASTLMQMEVDFEQLAKEERIADAEVKNIPLRSLPYSVLRRMGLPLSDSKGPMKLTGSPEGTWICPVTLRRKGQKAAENMSSVLGSEFQAAPGPHRMSFVSYNQTAYKLLKDVTLGKGVSTHRSHTSLLPQGSAPRLYQSAVVIYHGNIYLSIRRSLRSQRKQQTQLTSQSSIPSTSSSKGQRKELLNNNRSKRKSTTCKVTQSETKKGVRHKVREVFSSKTIRSVPQSTSGVHKVDGHCHKDAEGQQAAEEATVLESVWFQPEEEQETAVANMDIGGGEMQNLEGEEAESTNQNSDIDANMQITEPVGAACASTSLLKMDDAYDQLVQHEKISQLAAKLRRNETVPNNFSSV